MSSSMSTGDRRWASSTRRSSLTVLGKIAVPKPINLPSQRLENHGLDPNVEIVPKGAHSCWGSKSSSQNAWGSVSVSPSTDGGTGSPSHLSGRPSSVGSTTRPSTAGSDRPHEPAVNAWGTSSRPSSASGILSSSQSSLSTLRPRSAETRPGSSQLSRFAEPLSESTDARVGTTDKGISSSKMDGFSLASGDFPTLGSEKEKSGKNIESQGDARVTARSDSGATDTWRSDEPHSGEDDRPSEKRQEDAHSYPNASMPPHHYDTWHGPPVNNPGGGLWYRGPPYGAPLPSGGFPMETFPYYNPHFPSNTLVNPQPIPPRGAGPRGHQPINGDMYRPLMPDPYIRPGLAIRPGFYPGPVSYEGYFGRPMGYRAPSEQDMSFMGMPRGPVYSGYPNQNAPDPANFHVRPGGHTEKTMPMDHVESDYFHDSRGPYKLLMKQHNSSDGKMLENPVIRNIEKGDQTRNSRCADWELDNKMEDLMAAQSAEHSETNIRVSGKHTVSDSVCVHSPDEVGNKKLPDIRLPKKVEISASSSVVSRSIPAVPKDSTLIQKIEGLNAKARVSDTQPEVVSHFHGEEKDNNLQINPKTVVSAYSGGTGSLSAEGFQSSGTRKPVTHEADFPFRRYTGKHSRTDDRGKGNINQEFDSWRKTTPAAGSLGNVFGAQLRTDANQYSQEHHRAAEGRERPATYSQRKHCGASARQMIDGNNSRGQEYGKMRESVKQHSIQNEGEHMTKQIANAVEKSKEFKRHLSGVQNSNQKLENVLGGAIINKKEESRTLSETKVIAVGSLGPNTASVSAPYPILVPSVDEGNRIQRPTSSESLPERRPKRAQKDAAAVQKQHLSFQMEVNNLDVGGLNNVPQNRANTASKHKRAGSKHKQNIPSESILEENSVISGIDVAAKFSADESAKGFVPLEVTCDTAVSSETSVPASHKTISELEVHQRRRSNWTGKGKQRVHEGPCSASLSPRKVEIPNTKLESGSPKLVESELVLSSAQLGTDSKNANQSSEQHLLPQNEEIPDSISSQFKYQHSRRVPRNPQGNRSMGKFHSGDAVVWAPVRSQDRNEVTDEDRTQNRNDVNDDDTSRKTVFEAAVSSQKIDHQVQTNSKSKRAEIERYVPKPVAKEKAQQSMAPLCGQSPACETVERVDSDVQCAENLQFVGTIEKGGSSMEPITGDSRHNKQGKTHGSWRQRSSESDNTRGGHGGYSYFSDTSKNNSVSAKPDGAPRKEQSQTYSDRNISDGWNNRDFLNPVAQSTLVKDQGATARGKRQLYKGHKSTGSSYDQDKNTKNEDGDNIVYSSACYKIHTNLTSVEEDCNVLERPTSHWQPKARGSSYRRGGRTSGRDDIRSTKRDYLPQSGEEQPKEASQVYGESQAGHAVDQKINVEEFPDQYKREKEPSSSQGRSHTPKHASAGLTDYIPTTADTRHEQLPSSRRNTRSNRLSRGHDSSAEWSVSGQDYRQHNQSGNWERLRNNATYQYKPVGPNNNKSNDDKGSKDGFQETGSKYADRGRSNSRRGRGNPYGQQRGHVRVDAGCD